MIVKFLAGLLIFILWCLWCASRFEIERILSSIVRISSYKELDGLPHTNMLRLYGFAGLGGILRLGIWASYRYHFVPYEIVDMETGEVIGYWGEVPESNQVSDLSNLSK